MASTQHTPTELEAAGDLVLPAADELAGRFPLTPNAHPATPEEYGEIMSTLAFGKKFTDHMAHMRWTREGGWDDRGVIPYGPLELTPGASVFHYCQSVFEGIKAYKREDGSVWTFRPGYNAARLNHSARRLALPELSREDFVASLVDYVRADVKWVPDVDGSSLYLRPFMFASEEFVGVHPAGVVDYYVIGSPSGPYFKGGLSGVAIWVEGKYLEELGGMNMFVVMADGTIRTPELTGVILEGGTRSAILRMLRDQGVDVREEKIALSEVVDGIRSGAVAEVFACGTAAVVTPITRLAGDDFDVEIEVGDKTREIHKHLTDIQWGRAEDPYGWTYRLV